MKHQLAELNVNGQTFHYAPLKSLEAKHPGIHLKTLPFSQKILLENAMRHKAPELIINALLDIHAYKKNVDMSFHPARVLMQDFTGVPAIVDLAAMRDALHAKGMDATKVNPLIPVDLVIDHSVIVDHFGTEDAFSENVKAEYERNIERYRFLSWGQKAFKNFRVVPPGTGICHQVNLEYLAKVVFQQKRDDGTTVVYPDTLVGTDSHTTMVNGLAVLGWGVGGIEAEAAMLGQAYSMLIPEVIGFKMTGKLVEGVTATDLVLTVTNILRSKGVVGKFVEFFGDGLDHLSLADRATVANMAPEYGATCGFFPIDNETLDYLRFTGRSDLEVDLVEAYAKAQYMWRHSTTDADYADPEYADTVHLDLSTIRPTIAGPKRPQDKVLLEDAKASCETFMGEPAQTVPVKGESYNLTSGDVVIAAITSCTNTSNPAVLMAAGLLARKAHTLGLNAKPWVKTSLAPGSKVVIDYLKQADLLKDLEAVGFYHVGYGCTTCIGNSGPLNAPITEAIEANDMTVSAVLSGNRNFEGRVNPYVKANYLASPPLVVAYAIAGTLLKDLTKDPIGTDTHGNAVYLKDIWPSNKEIAEAIRSHMTPAMYKTQYASVFEGDSVWKSFANAATVTYAWDDKSTYVKNPPYFREGHFKVQDVNSARILALLGDSITTDHISPAGNIKATSPAGHFLQERGVTPAQFNAYGARRGNHDIMVRGTFANIRIKNEILQDIESYTTGGVTKHYPSNKQVPIFEAAELYAKTNTPLVVIAGKEYGTGSSRDWAAKGTRLLGVKAVIAESFERIHRSNLVGMGVLPLLFPKGVDRKTLHLKGHEIIDLVELENGFHPGMTVPMIIHYSETDSQTVELTLNINTSDEVSYFRSGGILPYVLNQLAG
ncbi:MAG: aconitate hydratase AcnA [Alphaproteobacteria bacterium]|nr:aconitate hydratase AcnA [Alphaproteobacteria bacterium]